MRRRRFAPIGSNRHFFALPIQLQDRIQQRIDYLGRNLRSFSHQRMQGIEAFRLGIADYRVSYQFDVQKNELYLIAMGHRRDVYKEALN